MRKKAIIIITVITVLCLVFFGIVWKIKQDQTIQPEQYSSQKETSYLTGEVLEIGDILDIADAGEVSYIAFRYDTDNKNQEYNEVYYIYDEAKVQKIMELLQDARFHACSVDVTQHTKENGIWLWLGISEEVNLLMGTMSTDLDMNWCTFGLVQQADAYCYEGNADFEQFLLDYYYNFFWNDTVSELLLDILTEEISQISLAEVRQVIDDGTDISRGYFQQYRHTIVSDYKFEEADVYAEYMKYELSDDSGYLYIYDSLEQGGQREILRIEWYDTEDVLQEVLYEAEAVAGSRK